MKTLFPQFVAGSLLIFALGCKPEPKARWDSEALTPLVNSRVEINDLVADSSLVADPDGSLSLYFRNELAELLPEEIMTPLNHEFENTAKLQSISLGNRTVTDHVSLGQLAQGGSPAGQFIINNHGQTAASPPFDNVGLRSFPYDATDYFQTIDLISGQLELTFYNELPVHVTDVEFKLENRHNGTVVVSSLIDSLKSRESRTETFSLANKTISGELLAVLENFHSPGSDGEPVLIDTSDKIIIHFKITDLNPSSATAIFPDQDIARDTTNTDDIQAGNALLEEIRIRSGKMYMEATSTIEDQITLEYLIPGLTRNGSPLDFNEKIDGAPPGGTSSHYAERDLSGYDVDLTGRPGEFDVYNRFYTIFASSIDSTGNIINLSLQDSVYLKTGISNLTAERGFGYLGKDTINSQVAGAANLMSFVDSGNFDLEDARLGISIENFIGAPVDLYINQLQAQRGNASTDLNWTNLGKTISVPPATLGSDRPRPAQLDILIDRSTSNIDELLELAPETLMSDLTGIINGSTSSPDFNQFIYAGYGVRTSFFIEIPLHLSASGLKLADTAEFDYARFDEDNRLQNGTLKLIGENNFPLDATVDLILLDAQGEKTGTLTSADKLTAANVDSEGRATGAVKSTAEYPLSTEKVALLRDTKKIVFRVGLTSASPPDKIRIYNTNYIDVTLAGDLTIRAN